MSWPVAVTVRVPATSADFTASIRPDIPTRDRVNTLPDMR